MAPYYRFWSSKFVRKSKSLSLAQTAFDLPNPFVTRHLEPGLARHPKPLAVGIDLLEQVQRIVA
jgi:hypothetical protein